MTRTRQFGLCLAVVCAAAGSPLAATASSSYTVLDLGALGGPSSLGYGVNASGQVAGQADLSSSAFRGFLTNADASLVPTNILGLLPGGSLSVAYGLNDTGEAVGFANAAGVDSHAFVFSCGLHDLGTFGGASSVAFSINNSGVSVGSADTGPTDKNGAPISHAFVHTGTDTLNAVTDDLGTLGGDDSTAQAVNGTGTVAGEAQAPDGNFHAFRHTDTGALTAADDLGTLGGSNSFAYGLNSLGQVVGMSDIGLTDTNGSPIQHAFSDGGGKMTDIGTLSGDLDSDALGINNLGMIVGESDSADLSVGYKGARAFLDEGVGLIDLNTLIGTGLGYVLTDADAINSNGQIIANGYDQSGISHAFLLTPCVAVPEPSALSLVELVGLGLAYPGVRRRRSLRP